MGKHGSKVELTAHNDLITISAVFSAETTRLGYLLGIRIKTKRQFLSLFA